MRAVLDSNVVLSALVFGRRLFWLRRAWASGAVTPIACRETVTELLRVLAYPKFRLDAAPRSFARAARPIAAAALGAGMTPSPN